MADPEESTVDANAETRSRDDSTLLGDTAGAGAAPALERLPTAHGGRYTTADELGRGGLGRVLRVHDKALERTIAVKELIRHDEPTQRRFVREVLITARLQHPAIVPVYEAGRWEDGAPFYAMKLVKGRTLGDAIDRAGDLAARIALVPAVLAVADAVAYAHSERIIHRDLKPGNVLLGDFGETVVIDWGLAKDLWGHDLTRSSEMSSKADETGAMGTPAYMAPEQTSSGVVDERADVYALGAMLYHVLAGAPPHQGKNLPDVFRRIAEGDIVPLAERVPGVPTDLAAIVTKAMRLRPSDRYPSAREVADDLRRFQTGQLVAVHRYTVRERLRRWVSRHRAITAVVSAALILLVVGGAFSVQSILRAERRADAQRRVAEENRGAAEDLLDFMLVDLNQKLQQVNRVALLDSVARRARAYYESRPATTPADRRRRALARLNIGTVLLAQNDTAGALAELEGARSTLEELAAATPGDPDIQRIRSQVYERIGTVKRAQGDAVAALEAYRTALAIDLRQLENDGDVNVLRAIALDRDRIANVLRSQGDTAGALVEYREALAVRRKLVESDPTHTELQRDLTGSHDKIGEILFERGDSTGALAEHRAGLAIVQRLADADPTHAVWQRDLGYGHATIGRVLETQGDLTGALEEIRRGERYFAKLAADDEANLELQAELATMHIVLGNLLRRLGDDSGAMTSYKASLAIRKRLAASDPASADRQYALAASHDRVGNLLLDRRAANEALVEYRAARELRERLLAASPDDVGLRRALAISDEKLGDVLLQRRDAAGAVAAYRRSEQLVRQALAVDPGNGAVQRQLSIVHRSIADALLAGRDRAGALAEYQTALAIVERLVTQDPANADWAAAAKELRELVDTCCR